MSLAPPPCAARRHRSRLRDAGGQASVELVGVLPFVALVLVVLWQLAIAGQAWWLAHGAARSAARAHALELPMRPAVARQLPPRLERGVRIREARDGIAVTVRIPLVVGSGALTTVRASARFPEQGR